MPLVLIPEGIYQVEMETQLRSTGYTNICIVPMMAVVWQYGLKDRTDIETIFDNPASHFVLFRADWQTESLWHIMLQPLGIPVDCFCELGVAPEETFEGLPLKTLGELQQGGSDGDAPYFIVMDAISQECLERAGITEERMIRFVFTDALQYFDETVNPYRGEGQEVFIDGGVLDLNSSRAFLKYCHGDCAKIYAFEPSERNLELCRKVLARDSALADVVALIPKGLWSKTTTLLFRGNKLFNGASRFVDANDNDKKSWSDDDIKVPVTSIDEVLQGERVTFIKFDIEGSELEGLKGARKTIETYHPTLAISIYHKPQDIIELPEYIKGIAPGYRFYLRSYEEDTIETVLYGIWPK